MLKKQFNSLEIRQKILYTALFAAAVFVVGLFFYLGQEIKITPEEISEYEKIIAENKVSVILDYEAREAPTAMEEATRVYNEDAEVVSTDIGPQPHLQNPPKVVKALYATAWSASSQKKMNYLIDLVRKTELNAIVIDIKDFSGYISYDSEVDLVERYGAEQIRIPRINALIKQLHDEGIYVIARVSVFQDPILAKARPDLAVKSSSTGSTWYDRKGLAWTDPASKEVWEYNTAIAKEASQRGFDEINFDYVRFPSDGDLSDMVFDHWDGSRSKPSVIGSFWDFVNEEMSGEGAFVSADLFGLTTTHRGGLGIGQIIENAYPNFDAVAPMVYPSHYASGFLGYKKPAEHPYDVIYYSMKRALERLYDMYEDELVACSSIETTSTTQATSTASAEVCVEDVSLAKEKLLSKLRPWLQDFDLGADYTPDMVRAQVRATYDAACDVLGIPREKEIVATSATSTDTEHATSSSIFSSSNCEPPIGWMLWNPSNIYTEEALLPAR